MDASDFLQDSARLPIETLVCDRCEVLGLKRAHLIRRSGYKNEAKGHRRLEALFAGDFEGARGLIAGLPFALDLPTDVVSKAVEESQAQIYAAEDARWRSSFRPHAIILTERTRPEPIFLAAIIGVERLLRIDFDLTADRASYVNQAINGVRLKLAGFKGESGVVPIALPAFGRPLGFVVNYSPDRAVRFDLEGNALEILPEAYRIGEASLSIGGQEIGSVFGINGANEG